jgi:hypothetical protein
MDLSDPIAIRDLPATPLTRVITVLARPPCIGASNRIFDSFHTIAASSEPL